MSSSETVRARSGRRSLSHRMRERITSIAGRKEDSWINWRLLRTYYAVSFFALAACTMQTDPQKSPAIAGEAVLQDKSSPPTNGSEHLLDPSVTERVQDGCSHTGTNLNYCGGNLLATSNAGVVFVPVLWGNNGDPTTWADIPGYYSALAASNYLSWLSEYIPPSSPFGGVGKASVLNNMEYPITPFNKGTGLSQTAIVTEIGQQIKANKLPAPQSNYLYMIHFSQGVLECAGNTGYHNTGTASGFTFAFAVIPDHSPTSNCLRNVQGVPNNYLDQFEVHISHEVAESIIDPDGSGGWNSANTNNPSSDGENGDTCEDQIAGGATFVNPSDQSVHFGQYLWDNSLTASSEPYFVGPIFGPDNPTLPAFYQNSCYTPRFRALTEATTTANPQFDASQSFLVGDFAGKGRDDIARVSNSLSLIRIDVFANTATGNTGNGYAAPANWDNGSQGSFASDMPFFVGHFSAVEGPEDIADAWNNGGCIALDIHENMGAKSFLLTSQAGQGNCYAHGIWNDRWHWVAGDFNGDGLTDIATIWSEGSSTSNQEVIDLHLATGSVAQFTGFTDVPSAATNQGPAASDGLPPTSEQWFAGDVDGDGLADLVSVSPQNGINYAFVHKNLGACSSSSTSCRTTAAFSDALVQHLGVVHPGAYFVSGDFDNDGEMDLAEIFIDPQQPANATSTVASVDVFRTQSTIKGNPLLGTIIAQERWGQWISPWIQGSKLFAADMNNDGRIDIGSASGFNVLGVTGTGLYSWLQQ